MRLTIVGTHHRDGLVPTVVLSDGTWWEWRGRIGAGEWVQITEALPAVTHPQGGDIPVRAMQTVAMPPRDW